MELGCSSSSSKLGAGFWATQRLLSFTESPSFGALCLPPSRLRHGSEKSRQPLVIRSTAAATETGGSTMARPHRAPSEKNPKLVSRQRTKPGNRIMSRDGRPPPPRQKFLGVRDSILRPPIEDSRLADKFLRSPQLSLRTLPLLSSCLPYSPLSAEDEEWMEEHFPEIRDALGYRLQSSEESTLSPDDPLYHRDTLLFLAFQHPESERSKRKAIRIGHSRLCFLGEFVLELALAELFLLRYPRESPACIRERIFGLINRKTFPQWIKAASLDGPLFAEGIDAVRTDIRLQNIRGIFWALVGALYLCMGMSEVYRFLFEVCGFDPDAKICQPKPRVGREDFDYVFPLLEEKQVDWQDLSLMKTADDDLFAKPLLYRACVPPGMQRFRGNLWEIDSLPKVLQIMGYPLPALDADPTITMARNSELELGLQLCFLHPSMYKTEHPRFCNERFEYLGSKIQDVVMAEKLLMKHLDAPGHFIKEKHRRLLFNRVCGKYFREKGLQKFIMFAEERKGLFEKARKLRNLATTGVSLALHGFAYAVYGKADVRRIMFELFDYERLQSPQ